MLNTHQLNVFLIAAETLNFTQTAKRLHLTQSSVSQHMKSLESQLGVELFIRRGRCLEITDAGHILIPLARDIVDGSIRAAEKMELLKDEIHGNLIIGCNTAPGKYLLPLLLAKFHELYPLVKISCQVRPLQQTIEELSNGSIHIAISNVEDVAYESCEFLPLLEEPIVLIAPIGHPWALSGEIEPEDLSEGHFIMREKTSGSYRYLKRGLLDVGIEIEHLDTFLEMGTSEALALAVEKGLGVGFVSQLILDKICPGRVAKVAVKGLMVEQPIYIGRQSVHQVAGAQAAFWDFVTELGPELFSLIQRDKIV